MAEAELPPAVTADAVAAAKALLRLNDDSEDAALAAMVATAIGLAEAFVGQKLIARSFEDRIVADGVWHRLAAEPVTAITTSELSVDIDAGGVGWVRGSNGGTVSVNYIAGLAVSWDAMPPALAQGAAMLAAHLFEQRGGEQAPPAAIAALWRPWRRIRLAGTRR